MEEDDNAHGYCGDEHCYPFSRPRGNVALDPDTLSFANGHYFDQCPHGHAAEQRERAAVTIEQEVADSPQSYSCELWVPDQQA
mgnify:CR=1 FL=1